MSSAKEGETDRFGLPYLTTEQEVGIASVLLIGGAAFMIPALLTLASHGVNSALLGFVMLGTSFVFLLEAVRELEEEDHFLSAKLDNQ